VWLNNMQSVYMTWQLEAIGCRAVTSTCNEAGFDGLREPEPPAT